MLLAACLLVAACGGKGKASSSGSAIGSSTSGSAPTASTGSASASSSSTFTSSTGNHSSSTSIGSTSSTTGGITGPVYTPCPTDFAYFAGNCLAASCAGLPYQTPCGLPDSGVGFCAGGGCQALDLSSDPQNCGELGLACPDGGRCSGSVCLGPSGAVTACPADHCPAGRVCVAGLGCPYTSACTGASNDAPCKGAAGAATCCGDAGCVDPSTDPRNCGGCGLACSAGAACFGGVCIDTVCPLDAGFGTTCLIPGGSTGTCCGGVCVDVLGDPANCGVCGALCPPDMMGGCSGGTCVPPCLGPADCPGEACVNGACLPTTCGAGSQQSRCALVESPGLTLTGGCCGSVCVALQDDPANCGQCGASCAGGACADGLCVGYPPIATCGQVSTGSPCWSQGKAGLCCGGACTTSDDANCGGCGRGCPPGATCTDFGSWPQCLAAGAVVTCSTGGCGTGQACDVNGNWCILTACTLATEGEACAVGLANGFCCGGACVDTSAAAKNCGLCGQACPTGQTCVSGFCSGTACTSTSCPSGTVCDPQIGCVSAGCADAGAGRICAFGIPLGGTSPGYGICCGGKCVDFTQDPNNCGNCGLDCDGGSCLGALGRTQCYGAHPTGVCLQTCAPGTYCSGGGCLAVTCEYAGQVCPAPDGPLGLCCATSTGRLTCADVSSDPESCGACAVRCPAGQTCQGGVCSGTPAPCNVPGQRGAFCNLPADSTSICCPGLGCVDTAVDSQNCGGCGVGCPLGTSCASGTCQ